VQVVRTLRARIDTLRVVTRTTPERPGTAAGYPPIPEEKTLAAAPIFRRLVQVYYFGAPQSLFPWEATYGVPKTPTPIGGIPTRTPNPNDN